MILLAPLGAFIGNGLAFVLTWLQNSVGWLMTALLAAFMPLVVMAGMHYALVPNCLTNLGTLGFDTILGPTMLASNFSQAAASAAVAMRSKNRDIKAVAVTSSVSAAVAGITEPALYGVTLRLKRPLIASMIGSGAAGLFAGAVGLQNYALVTPSLVAMVQFVSADLKWNFLYACITVLISVVVTFIMTLILGWEDEDTDTVTDAVTYPEMTESEITSPLCGNVIPLSEVKDETFASGVLGEGVAVLPTAGKVYAPFDGSVVTIFETKHAMGLMSDMGTELLIHIGLETVTLNGEGFEPVVESGASIKRGDLLMQFDLDMLKAKGFDVTTPIIISNHAAYENVITYAGQANIDQTAKILEVVK